MDSKSLMIALAVGTVLQLAMIVAGHYVPFVRDKVFMLGGLALSLLAGVLYAKLAHAGWGSSLTGGAVGGGLCAMVAIAVSVVLKDTAPMILAVGTLGSAVTGLIGGAIGKLIA